MMNTSQVPDSFSYYRLDKYLAVRFNYHSRSKWQKEISEGRVQFNGKIVMNIHKKIMAGDFISYHGSNYDEPDVDRNYSIIYEDQYIIAVNKSGNLPVHPSGKFFHNTLLSILETNMKIKLYPVHRLDRETSGIILFAKSSEITSSIHKNFSNFHKMYIAIVHGIPDTKNFVIKMPIGADNKSQIRKKRGAFLEAKDQAITYFQIMYQKNDYSLIKATPITGKLHQIRVHLNYAGFPILGDKLYGIDESLYLDFIKNGNSKELIEKLKFHRSALHAWKITFFHPVTQKQIQFKSPVPKEFLEFLKNE